MLPKPLLSPSLSPYPYLDLSRHKPKTAGAPIWQPMFMRLFDIWSEIIILIGIPKPENHYVQFQKLQKNKEPNAWEVWNCPPRNSTWAVLAPIRAESSPNKLRTDLFGNFSHAVRSDTKHNHTSHQCSSLASLRLVIAAGRP